MRSESVESGDVAGGEGEGRRRVVDGVDDGLRQVRRQRDGDCAAAGADVGDGEGRVGSETKSLLDQKLGLGTRDERVRCRLEVEAEELA